jgi:hypothetical protein
MIPVVELIILLIVIIVAYQLLHSIKHAIINTVIGLIILALANIYFNQGIAYSIWTILVCAVGGAPGAFLVVILHYLKIAF